MDNARHQLRYATATTTTPTPEAFVFEVPYFPSFWEATSHDRPRPYSDRTVERHCSTCRCRRFSPQAVVKPTRLRDDPTTLPRRADGWFFGTDPHSPPRSLSPASSPATPPSPSPTPHSLLLRSRPTSPPPGSGHPRPPTPPRPSERQRVVYVVAPSTSSGGSTSYTPSLFQLPRYLQLTSDDVYDGSEDDENDGDDRGGGSWR